MEEVQKDEVVEKIMSKYCKEDNDNKEQNEDKRELRIRAICREANVSYVDYMKALERSDSGYKVVLARDIDELYINNYNVEMIRAWNANMDLQPVLNHFAVITYVTDYLTKAETSVMEILKSVLKDSEATDVKERMKEVANVFLKYRQMGNAEAVYKLIPELTLTNSNVTTKFAVVGPQEKRSRPRVRNSLHSTKDAGDSRLT